MKRSDLITVAIPYHQNLPYLQKALDSICQQTLLPAEVIIIDNSIEGDAMNITGNCPVPVRHIRSDSHLGLAAYFNQCLDAAQTKWCTIMHSDDMLHIHYIDAMSHAVQEHPDVTGIFCKAHTIDSSEKKIFYFKDWFKNFLWPAGKEQALLQGEKGLAAIMRGNFIMCPTMCYNLRQLGEKRFNAAWSLTLDLEFNGRILPRQKWNPPAYRRRS